MQQIIKTLIFVTFMIFFMTTCDKDSPVEDLLVMPQDTTFCGYIDAERFDKTRIFMDSFLLKLPKNHSIVASLDTLVLWLNQKECVLDAQVICYGCLFSLPPKGEIGLKLKIKSQIVKGVFTVKHNNPLICSEIKKF